MAPKTLADLREKEREARRELVLSVAQRLFAERDFRSVTVREIAREAGLSPGAIYRYYASLDELFLELSCAGAREMTRRVDELCGPDGGCSLEELCELFVGYLNENMTFYKMMSHFMLGGRLSPDATERLNPVMRDLLDRIEAVLRRAGAQGDTRILCHALYASLNGIMISYAQYPGRTLEEIRRHTLRLARVVASVFRSAGAVSSDPALP